MDDIAAHPLRELLEKYPAEVSPEMRTWSRDTDRWKRRSSIICQLNRKQETDLALLFDCIDPNLTDPDFFIRKGIGWALRSLAWTDLATVERYIAENGGRISGAEPAGGAEERGEDQGGPIPLVPWRQSMTKAQTTQWDPADHLETDDDMAAYLNVALEDGDLSLIMATLEDIARAKRMTVVAQEAGVGRESLYESLSSEGNPEFATVLKVVHASASAFKPPRCLSPATCLPRA